MGEGRLVMAEGYERHRQLHLDPCRRVEDASHAKARENLAPAFDQFAPLRGRKDPRGLVTAGELPVRDGLPCAGAEGAVDGGGVESFPEQRLLDFGAFIGRQKPFGIAGVGQRLLSRDQCLRGGTATCSGITTMPSP